MPEISVIIPAFNRADSLRHSVGSVLAQSFQDFEVIVVDDASTDNTAGAVEQIGDRRVRLLRLDKNGGAARTRNEGVRAATGRWIAFLDSDDLWKPEKLSRQLASLRACPDPERTLCAHAHEISDGTGTRVWPRRGPLPGEPMADYLFVANGNLQTSTWMWHRDLCAKFPFDPALRRHEDWKILLDLEAKDFPFLWLSEPLAVFECRPSPSRLSNTVDAEFSLQFLEMGGPLFGKKAKTAFEVRIIAPQLYLGGNRIGALRVLARKDSLTALGPGEYLKFLVWLCAPRLHAAGVSLGQHFFRKPGKPPCP